MNGSRFSAYSPDDAARADGAGIPSIYATHGRPAADSCVPRSRAPYGPQPPPSGVQSLPTTWVDPLEMAR